MDAVAVDFGTRRDPTSCLEPAHDVLGAWKRRGAAVKEAGESLQREKEGGDARGAELEGNEKQIKRKGESNEDIISGCLSLLVGDSEKM